MSVLPQYPIQAIAEKYTKSVAQILIRYQVSSFVAVKIMIICYFAGKLHSQALLEFSALIKIVYKFAAIDSF